MSLYTADSVLSKLVNILMRDGKKSTAQRIVDEAFWILKREYQVPDPASYAKEAIEQAKPVVELTRYRLSGRNLQVPSPLMPHRATALALRAIRDAVRSERRERGAAARLAAELVDIHRQQGVAWKRRQDLHKMAEANKMFTHLR
ncbi:mitochondrial ribosomal protein S7, precursor [Cyanidioschyzon merolae strain 10D]|jgi:small subunit ribosomal protein S7|uniref:Mitochondrial ribosomal protein S7 n=1 Tax=Cyanidioschyzon merolae (strain NIES-3377 / 10D) TaxID=280699 RepID=M1VCX2_CYAM1|nr:mitochondrial ribosomal protein S7, precursor [Cyanidioschyzon merolae strain 10D]BAM83414.1 mitochondrial ribosomal protein S7, precursor [Cyanidioschyzon merolae strain 10D]|eukprot:XP_005539450.1 mitochondrial ribosomal protein S7, precursor [Cyanidioschyzon merolae strain 10D]